MKMERKIVPEIMEWTNPVNLVPSFTEKGDLSLSFSFFNEDEAETLKDAASLPF